MAEVVNTAGAVAAIIYERMQGITVANGFETNMGLTIFQGRVKVADEQVIKAEVCASIIEGIDVPEDQRLLGSAPEVKLEQRYGLVGYSVCDPDAPNEAAHRMLRDMKRAIWRNDATFDGAVKAVRYRSRDIGPRADGVNIVMALLEFGVVYVENLTKP